MAGRLDNVYLTEMQFQHQQRHQEVIKQEKQSKINQSNRVQVFLDLKDMPPQIYFKTMK